MMKKFLLTMVVALVAMTGQSWAASSDSITVTVSLGEVVSVTLDSNSWSLGSIALSGSYPSPSYTATNDGNVAIDLDIAASDGAGGWSIASSAGTDAFAVDVSSPSISLSPSPQSLASNVAAASTKSIDMTYEAPTGDTYGGGVSQGFTITVTATMHVP